MYLSLDFVCAIVGDDDPSKFYLHVASAKMDFRDAEPRFWLLASITVLTLMFVTHLLTN